MTKKFSAYFEFIADILSILFSYSFVFYLILYLLETIIPGFVTDNFSLNWVLVPTLVFGVLSAIFPIPEDEERSLPAGRQVKPATKFDLIFTIALAIGSFFLIFFKFKIDNLTLKWVVSLISSFLTLFLGLMLLYFPDDLVEEEEIESKSKIVKFTYNFKRFFLSRFKIPVPIALLIAIVLFIFIPQNTAKILHRSINQTSNNQATEPSIAPLSTNEIIEKPLPPADPNIKIIVTNAGTEKGEAKRIGNLFKTAGYTNVEATDSAKNIENALIEFRDTESAQADLVEDILKGEYLTVNRTPLAPTATTSAEIRVSLGAQPKPADDTPDYQDENFDFFFN